MLRASVIIPTYNRPVELTNCIRSILDQSGKPAELIIVDDGNLADPPLQKECTEKGIRYLYIRKEKPGLAESRNVGAKVAQGDIIFYFDDDVILSSEYIEEVLKVYEEDQEKWFAGVAGVMSNVALLSAFQHFRKIFHIIFLTVGLKEGKVLPSGFVTDFGTQGVPLEKVQEVDFFHGYAMSFRKEIFQEFSFDEKKYQRYGLGEDQDFSYRVSKKYKLIATPRARVWHLESEKMRPDQERIGRNLMIHRFIFFRDQVKKGWWGWVLFWYALIGFVLLRVVLIPLSLDKEKLHRAKGILKGIKDILLGKAEGYQDH
ncbi:MAG TPA: glycosyltransferase family 2 protein [Thermodesulfobacteriota bacterium]|nr:glycosyltransferase family 2 protein [Thermodesulfobacteriota bacterium]